MEGQEKLKQYNELSREELNGFKNTILRRYEEYINSDREKRTQIISQILIGCGLDIKDTNNRKKVSKFITQEMERLQRENKKQAKTIKSVILANNDALFNEYWAAKKLCNNKEREKRIKEIVSYILEEVGLEYNNLTIQRVKTFMCNEKERRDEEERRKTGAEILASMEEDTSKIKDVILENRYHITYFTCNYKDKGKIISDILEKSELENNHRNRQKIISKINSMKDKSKPKEVVNQSVSKIIGKGRRLGNVDKKLDKQLNNQPAEEQDTTCDVAKTPIYTTKDANDANDDTLPFFLDTSILNGCEEYCENSYSL